MAVIYSYPNAASSSLSGSDLLVISKMDANGRPTKSVTLSSLATFIGNSSALGGPFLPLSAGPTVPLTGDLYLAPNGSGSFLGSKSIVFRGVDDLGNELDGGRIFTQDSTIAPSGQDLVFNNADDNGVLQTNLFIDAFGSVGVGKTNPSYNLDVANSMNVDGSASFLDVVGISNATSNTKGLKFNHPAGGASGVVNMYYNGAAAGSKYVISRGATGGPEIELEADGDINLNRTGNGGILLGGLDAYADDAAAGAAGLTKDKLYQTDGSDPALPIAGIVMIKQ